MQIEYWFLIGAFLVIVAAIVFIRLCYLSDKKIIENEVLKNQTVFFVEHKPLQWKDLDFPGIQQPTIVLPEIGD